MRELPVIAIDAMGGDAGPRMIVPAVEDLVRSDERLAVLVVGQRDKIEPLMTSSRGIDRDASAYAD